MITHRLSAAVTAAVVALLLSGCGPASTEQIALQEPTMSQPPAKTTAAPVADDPAALYAEIKAMVGTAAATEPLQCKKTGLGHKPCGGPASYLIYSTQGLDEARLLQKVSRYNQLVQAEQERLGLVSDCAIVPEPGVALVGGFCVANGQGDTF
jgi:hypothetical protein